MKHKTKFTLTIPTYIITAIRRPLHHGEFTAIMRTYMEALAEIIHSEGINKVKRWMYMGEDLILPGRKEKK